MSKLENENINDIITWPFIPYGTRPVHKNNIDIKQDDVSNARQWQKNTYDSLSLKLDEFRQNQKLTIFWILAALLSLSSAISAISYNPTTDSWPPFIVSIAITIALILVALGYFPEDVNHRIMWIPTSSGWIFEGKYSDSIINSLKRDKLSDKANIKTTYSNLLDEELMPFAFFVCLVILRDSILKHQEYLKVKSISSYGVKQKPMLLLTINIARPLHLLLKRNLREILNSEAMRLTEGLRIAQSIAGVRAFDYSPNSWSNRGHDFLNEYLEWNKEEVEAKLIAKITET